MISNTERLLTICSELPSETHIHSCRTLTHTLTHTLSHTDTHTHTHTLQHMKRLTSTPLISRCFSSFLLLSVCCCDPATFRDSERVTDRERHRERERERERRVGAAVGGETADIRATAKYNKHTYTHTHTHTCSAQKSPRIKESRERSVKVCVCVCSGVHKGGCSTGPTLKCLVARSVDMNDTICSVCCLRRAPSQVGYIHNQRSIYKTIFVLCL